MSSGREADARAWSLIVPSFLAFWVLGLGMLWIATIPAALFAHQRMSGRQLHAAPPARWLLTLAIWLALVLGVTIVAGEAAPSRVVGAAFAVAAWFGAWCLYRVLRSATPRQMYRFILGLIFVSAVQGGMSLLAMGAHPSPLSRISLPASAVLSGSNVAPWTTAQFVIESYFGGAALRSNGLMATAAWTGGFAALMLILLVLSRSTLLNAGMRRSSWWIASALTTVSLVLSYSRLSWAIAGAIILAWAALSVGHALSPRGGRGLATVLLLAIGTVLVFTYDFQQLLAQQDALRPGSSTARIGSYTEGFEASVAGGPLVLIAGNGVKPYFELQDRGAGSESTYVSLLVRGGVVAVLLLLLFFAARLREALQTGDWTAAALVAATALHAMPADLDVGTLTVIFALVNPSWMWASEQGANQEVRRLPAISASVAEPEARSTRARH